MIGFYRETSQGDKSALYSSYALKLMEQMGLAGTVPYATTLLNAANAYRASGEHERSLNCYREVSRIYEKELAPEDFRFASLNNNLSLLYQEMEQYGKAVECLKNAERIAKLHPEAQYELAVTWANLGMSLTKLSRYGEALSYIERSLRLFLKIGVRDTHYGAALSAFAEILVQRGEYKKAEACYEEVLPILYEEVGKAESYLRVEANCQKVRELVAKQKPASHIKGLRLAEDYYYEYGEPMLREKFADFLSGIAAGLVGEGSDCFGFDDEYSEDHDFGPGFCLWLGDDLYDQIGEELKKACEELPNSYHGVERKVTEEGSRRVGVFRIRDFFSGLLGLSKIPETEEEWLYVEESALAAAVNGKVFRDDSGEFCAIREKLKKGYPSGVRAKKIAQESVMFAQTLQYNYERCVLRGDSVTAGITFFQGLEHAMGLAYLLNREYAPYYKWRKRGLADDVAVSVLIEELYQRYEKKEDIKATVEILAELFLNRMKEQEMILEIRSDETGKQDLFLAHYGKEISMDEKNVLVDQIVDQEWKAFDKVENEGGRADCQDDFDTFSIMRKSQYLTWNVPMLRQYLGEFEASVERGWNPITEKYARMMESTAPERYAQIRGELPQIPREKQQIIETIVGIQVGWMEDFAVKYPRLAAGARTIHTAQDTAWDTSYETYLRGEISTYSDEMLLLYGRFIAQLSKEKKNLAEMTMEKTAEFYGYGSLEEAENKGTFR